MKQSCSGTSPYEVYSRTHLTSSSTQVFALGNKTCEHFNAMEAGIAWTSGWNSSGAQQIFDLGLGNDDRKWSPPPRPHPQPPPRLSSVRSHRFRLAGARRAGRPCVRRTPVTCPTMGREASPTSPGPPCLSTPFQLTQLTGLPVVTADPLDASCCPGLHHWVGWCETFELAGEPGDRGSRPGLWPIWPRAHPSGPQPGGGLHHVARTVLAGCVCEHFGGSHRKESGESCSWCRGVGSRPVA